MTRSSQQLERLFDPTNCIGVTHYRLIRSQRKTLAVSVDKGQIIVRAPVRAPLEWINQFLIEKAKWIHSQLVLDAQQAARRIKIKHGSTITVAEQPLQISVNIETQRSKNTITLSNEALIFKLSNRHNDIDAQIYPLFFRWLTKQAQNYMTPRAHMLANEIARPLREVRFRRTRTKWGHCTSGGTIQFNPLIMLAPISVIHYLIAHEVAHLRHANHSKTFWRLVDQLHPHYEADENWLKQEGYRLAIEIPDTPPF